MPGDSSADGDPSSLPPLPAALSTAPADEEGRAGGSPPAPDLPPPARAAGGGIAAGGHLLRFEPAGGGPTQVGVLRVERMEDGRLRASGDLYDDPGGVTVDDPPCCPGTATAGTSG